MSSLKDPQPFKEISILCVFGRPNRFDGAHVMGKLETFPNRYPGREYEVNITCPEFTAVCPRTGQPDFGTIRITYVPNQAIIELKSLKLYMFSFRDQGIFHEHVTNKILDDVVEACDPLRCEIVGDFHVRGGIKTVVTARYEKE